MTNPDGWYLYRLMLESRLFEESVKMLHDEGFISGEMHMGIGEEGIVAGIVAHLGEGDALALDHRSTPPLIMRGVDPLAILRELLGQEDGLCAGQGGHMHLFSRQHLAASSGIVGSSGPAAAGFALSAQYQGTDKVAVAFFGEGALNQGMMMESLNLVAVWKLPVLFVCKDNGWAITTHSSNSMVSSPLNRARGFGLRVQEVDGWDAAAVSQVGGQLLSSIRQSKGPAFLLGRCRRPDGHMLGDPLLRLGRGEERADFGGIMRAITRLRGDSLNGRVANVRQMMGLMDQFAGDHEFANHDPLALARKKLTGEPERLRSLENEVTRRMEAVIRTATEKMAGRQKAHG